MFDTRAPCNVVKSTERRLQDVEHILGKVDRRAGIRLTEVASGSRACCQVLYLLPLFLKIKYQY